MAKLCVPICDNVFLVGLYHKANEVQFRATFQEHTNLNVIVVAAAADHTSRTRTRRGRR